MWNVLLECLHSACIDELVERHPEPKPVLGLPIQQNGMSAPEGTGRFLMIPAQLTHSGKRAGILCLAITPDVPLEVGKDLPDLWSRIVERAARDFARRQVRADFEAPKLSDALQTGTLKPRHALWYPFGLKSGKLYFGIAI